MQLPTKAEGRVRLTQVLETRTGKDWDNRRETNHGLIPAINTRKAFAALVDWTG